MNGKIYMTRQRRREDRKEKIRMLIPRLLIMAIIVTLTLLTLRECYP